MYDTDSFSDIVKPFSDRARFEGWYYDEALTKSAKGVIGTTDKIYAKWRTEKHSLKNTYDEDNVSEIEKKLEAKFDELFGISEENH